MPPSVEDKPAGGAAPGSDILTRVIAGSVLGPPVVAALYFGSPYSDFLFILAAGLTAWEWGRICGGAASPIVLGLMVGGVVLAGVAMLFSSPSLAGWVLLVAVMASMRFALRRLQDPVWIALGVAVIGSTVIALIWLRSHPVFGRELILWLFAVVWATDSGAYFAGRSLGGPKLAPRISPKKTWSGLLGGMLCAGLVGALGGFLLKSPGTFEIVATSMALALVSQGGDLFESLLKRRFGVKDAGNLIPGHGGLLDRTDGLIAASLCVAVVMWFGGEARLQTW